MKAIGLYDKDIPDVYLTPATWKPAAPVQEVASKLPQKKYSVTYLTPASRMLESMDVMASSEPEAEQKVKRENPSFIVLTLHVPR